MNDWFINNNIKQLKIIFQLPSYRNKKNISITNEFSFFDEKYISSNK